MSRYQSVSPSQVPPTLLRVTISHLVILNSSLTQYDTLHTLRLSQIGGARHWNVYAHSFLFFGVNGAFDRLNARLWADAANPPFLYNPCLPGGSRINHTSWIHVDPADGTLLPRNDPRSTVYHIELFNNQMHADYDTCSHWVYKLLRKEANKWVAFSHDGDCSFAGVYQPPLPLNKSSFGEFIATSNYADVWTFLGLPSRSDLAHVHTETQRICSMNMEELLEYNQQLPDPVHESELPQYCFRSTFVFHILHDGHGFPLDYKITAADVLNDQKLGWALGSILYEINTLPWEFDGKIKLKHFLWGDAHWDDGPSADDRLVTRLDHVAVIAGVVALVLAALGYRWRVRQRWSYERVD